MPNSKFSDISIAAIGLSIIAIVISLGSAAFITYTVPGIPDSNEYVDLYDESIELLDKMERIQRLFNELIQLEVKANEAGLENDKILADTEKQFTVVNTKYTEEYNELNTLLAKYSTNEQWDRYDEIYERIVKLDNEYGTYINNYYISIDEYNSEILEHSSNYIDASKNLANEISAILDD